VASLIAAKNFSATLERPRLVLGKNRRRIDRVFVRSFLTCPESEERPHILNDVATGLAICVMSAGFAGSTASEPTTLPAIASQDAPMTLPESWNAQMGRQADGHQASLEELNRGQTVLIREKETPEPGFVLAPASFIRRGLPSRLGSTRRRSSRRPSGIQLL
jgi:hypothetical protein